MSPRPTPQPITRAPRPEHPLARQEPPPRPAGQLADQQTSDGLTGRQRSTRRQDAVFSTRVPAGVKKQLRHYAFEHGLLVQDIVTDLLTAYLAEHDT